MSRSRLLTMILVLATQSCLGVPVWSQRRHDDGSGLDQLRIQFQGALINVSSGNVLHATHDETTPALAGEPLASGDTLKVADGRVEILLNPGYYLRLNRDTEIELLDLSYGNLKLKLLRGSAIFEITSDTWPEYGFGRQYKDHLFNVVTMIGPEDEFTVTQGGAYRFNVLPDEHTEILVLDGGVAVPGHLMKEKTRASILAGRIDLEVLDPRSLDDFDNWSRERALALIEANKSFKKRPWFKQFAAEAVALDKDFDIRNGTTKERMISARAGVVKFAEKGVLIKHSDSGWQELTVDTSLTDGDRLRTAVYARAEIRPYPNLYLFVEGDTELTYAENEQVGTTLSLARGSVIMTIPVVNRSRDTTSADVILRAGTAEYHLERNGCYRLNAGSGRTELIVRYGTVKMPPRDITGPKKIVGSAAGLNVESFDRATLDSFDVWADHRVARYVNPLPVTAPERRRWFSAAWVFDEATNQFTLVPGGQAHKSPYGGKYSVFYSLNPPPHRHSAPK